MCVCGIVAIPQEELSEQETDQYVAGVLQTLEIQSASNKRKIMHHAHIYTHFPR